MHSLGKSFQRSRQASQRNQRAKYRGIVEANHNSILLHEAERQRQQREGNIPLKSIWETSNLEEFLFIADAREKGYEATRDLRVVVDGTPHVVTNDKVMPMSNNNINWLKLSELLTIPRRPTWDYEMSAETIQRMETSAFFDWRRRLSKMEEEHKVVMTPYEKNLEVWRQLWRVVERADVVLMILDARNPLVFRCADFEAYVRETRSKSGKAKEIIFLLNKSDLLTEQQRMAWAVYFQERGEPFIFFSASMNAKQPMCEEKNEKKNNNEEGEDEDEGEEEEGEVDDTSVPSLLRNRKEKRRHKKKSLRAPVEVANPYELLEQRRLENLRRHQEKSEKEKNKVSEPPTESEKARDMRILSEAKKLRPWEVLDPVQLLDHLALWRGRCGIHDMNTPLMVGLVGYPNVGKSSTINAIIGCKKVVVSATPGKTKHFQTLVIPNERRVALCDCPGLVFPSFASTREQMVCDGILPIDTATDAMSAINVLCRRIPRQILEKYFNVSLRAEDDVDDSHSLAERFLHAVARRRGYLGAHDRPNKSRAARDILKLYVDGVILYVEPPPNYTPPADNNNNNKTAAKNYVDNNDEWEDVDECSSQEEEEGEDIDGDQWDDLDGAAEARAISEDGDMSDIINRGNNAFDGDEDENIEAAAPPMFYIRPSTMRGALTPQETFNAEANVARMKTPAGAVLRRKKRTNHQLEPATDTFMNNEGEVELIVDDDDGIIELVTGGGASKPNAGGKHTQQQRQKQQSKRQVRRELKRMGAGPVNPTARKMGVQGY